ncbi:hypothetical protein C8J56DRAFT_545051 [Mycena floridula]|nr:hypothetical protein C8J56DRAFT_545051 [Mycena floridula]
MILACLPRRLASASFSTTAKAANDALKPSVLNPALADYLDEESRKKSSYIPILDRDTPYKRFYNNSFTKPYDFSYKGRQLKQFVSKPPRLGPNRKASRSADPFYQLDIDPLDQAMNPALLCDYVSALGKIHPRQQNMLTTKNQRRLGKAIRRAKMMGIIPLFSNRNVFDETNLKKNLLHAGKL